MSDTMVLLSSSPDICVVSRPIQAAHIPGEKIPRVHPESYSKQRAFAAYPPTRIPLAESSLRSFHTYRSKL